jgi:hypothetical protein
MVSDVTHSPQRHMVAERRPKIFTGIMIGRRDSSANTELSNLPPRFLTSAPLMFQFRSFSQAVCPISPLILGSIQPDINLASKGLPVNSSARTIAHPNGSFSHAWTGREITFKITSTGDPRDIQPTDVWQTAHQLRSAGSELIMSAFYPDVNSPMKLLDINNFHANPERKDRDYLTDEPSSIPVVGIRAVKPRGKFVSQRVREIEALTRLEHTNSLNGIGC